MRSDQAHNGPGAAPIVIALVIAVIFVLIFLWMAHGYGGRTRT